MSLLHWFAPKKKHKRADAPASEMPSSGLSRIESTKPVAAARGNGAAGQPGNRKHERMARRELLYAVVREAMVRAGVLSSSYKFKVLSLDSTGRQFMVMVDLARGAASDTTRLAEIEAMVAQSAKARYDILVTAVYWRANEHVAVGDPAHYTAQKPLISQPAPLMDLSSRPAPLISQPAPLMDSSSRPAPLAPARRIDPLHPTEVDAFRKALDAGVRGEQALARVEDPAQSYTLLTGFEDTELAQEEGVNEHLSGTQFGALR
jgi:hypothetical protein